MGTVPTVRVVNPNDPEGGFMIINESDFDPAVHQLVEDEAPAERRRTPAPRSEPDEDPFPEGYRWEPSGGGYGHLYGPEGQLIEGPSNGKWQGRDAGLQAALHHVEQHAGDEGVGGSAGDDGAGGAE